MTISKKTLSEDDISVKFIAPALILADWDELTQIRRQVFFTKGRIIVRGRLVTRGKGKRADYILYYCGIPIAVIEVKDNNHAVTAGIQQALDYALTLDVPFVFATNGDAFVFHDRTGLESVYERVLAHELEGRGCHVERQVPVPITYAGICFEEGFRADLIINKCLLLELKSVERLSAVHKKQVLTYLRLRGLHLGLLINFGEDLMKTGIHRIINNRIFGTGASE